MNEDLKFLKELQTELNIQENDCQAAPRFWTIMDYKKTPGNEDYDSGELQYFFNDGDHVVFEDLNHLKGFVEEHYEEDIDDELRWHLNNEDFEFLWQYITNNLNDDGYFDSVFVKEEEFIAPNTMFLTKAEAKRHLELNHYHYTSKAHTYAMTAWRAPKVERLLKILSEFDFDSVSGTLSSEQSEGREWTNEEN
ncbi:hypothetical protein [Paenibacillus sp. 1781tsa1]|uniref:hypothetical protein n=1 Tax=Paenibacillus sp. 1781tsa1 TaxID=2953810 RepID=UPI0020A05842|nr:hypothetical protein [Paenibacillus sp. 1781tsa1]MCP1185011.1 hypothetical protein [Paenibacillus sp. 1781tsa1]